MKLKDRDIWWIIAGSFFVAIGAGILTGIGVFILTMQIIEVVNRK